MPLTAWESSQRGAAWLLAIPGDGDDLRAYYKTASAFLASGHPREAHRVLDHVTQRYLRDGGDLDGAGVPWFSVYRTYPHAWLCCAAVQAARFDLASALAGFIAGFHDEASGGFWADEARTTQEVMTTSMAALACLWSGAHRERALAAGAWLERLFRQQPDLRRGLYTSQCGGDLGGLVDASQPKQWYFQYGISAAFLTALAGATGDRRWRTLAQEFIDASEHCHADRHSTPQSGKLGWGAAWAGRPAIAAAVSAGLAALQNDDGSWLATGVYGGAQASADSVTIDVTAEFVTLQAWMAVA